MRGGETLGFGSPFFKRDPRFFHTNWRDIRLLTVVMSSTASTNCSTPSGAFGPNDLNFNHLPQTRIWQESCLKTGGWWALAMLKIPLVDGTNSRAITSVIFES